MDEWFCLFNAFYSHHQIFDPNLKKKKKKKTGFNIDAVLAENDAAPVEPIEPETTENGTEETSADVDGVTWLKFYHCLGISTVISFPVKLFVDIYATLFYLNITFCLCINI